MINRKINHCPTWAPGLLYVGFESQGLFLMPTCLSAYYLMQPKIHPSCTVPLQQAAKLRGFILQMKWGCPRDATNPRSSLTLGQENPAQVLGSCTGSAGARLQALESLSTDVNRDLPCDRVWKQAVQAVATYSKSSKGSRNITSAFLLQQFVLNEIPERPWQLCSSRVTGG